MKATQSCDGTTTRVTGCGFESRVGHRTSPQFFLRMISVVLVASTWFLVLDLRVASATPIDMDMNTQDQLQPFFSQNSPFSSAKPQGNLFLYWPAAVKTAAVNTPTGMQMEDSTQRQQANMRKRIQLCNQSLFSMSKSRCV